MKQFENAKVGDQVWSIKHGWGIITDIYADTHYPITVKYFTKSPSNYTLDGKCNSSDLYPEIYWDVVTFEYPKQPKRPVKKEIIKYAAIYPNTTTFTRLDSDYSVGSLYDNIKAVQSGSCNTGLAIAKVIFEFEVEE